MDSTVKNRVCTVLTCFYLATLGCSAGPVDHCDSDVASTDADTDAGATDLTLALDRDGVSQEIGSLVDAGWELVTAKCPARRAPEVLQFSVVDARHNDALLLSTDIELGPVPLSVVLAMRVRILSADAPMVEGELMIGRMSDGVFVELAHSWPPFASLPSVTAIYNEWFDRDPIEAVDVRSDLDRSIDRISWNGFCSAMLSDIVHHDADPPGVGRNYTVSFPMDEATATRTRGPIETWPEPVWLVRVKLRRVD